MSCGILDAGYKILEALDPKCGMGNPLKKLHSFAGSGSFSFGEGGG